MTYQSGSYVYQPTKPYCLFHGLGHWTKDCKKTKPTGEGETND